MDFYNIWDLLEFTFVWLYYFLTAVCLLTTKCIMITFIVHTHNNCLPAFRTLDLYLLTLDLLIIHDIIIYRFEAIYLLNSYHQFFFSSILFPWAWNSLEPSSTIIVEFPSTGHYSVPIKSILPSYTPLILGTSLA